MAMFWEFFTFEIRFRIKSISTYVYFLLWFAFSFLSVASESFGPVGNFNGKILLNGAYANSYNDLGSCLFGVIVIAAIFGTSILRDFQRDTYQILFTKPVSKFAYLGGRWAGSFVTTVFVFSGMLFGTFFGGHTMLWTVFLVLIVLWMLGVVSSYTLGGFIHVLLVLAVVALLVQLIQGRRVV